MHSRIRLAAEHEFARFEDAADERRIEHPHLFRRVQYYLRWRVNGDVMVFDDLRRWNKSVEQAVPSRLGDAHWLAVTHAMPRHQAGITAGSDARTGRER